LEKWLLGKSQFFDQSLFKKVCKGSTNVRLEMLFNNKLFLADLGLFYFADFQ
jgi:hypothetical protein